MPKEKLKPKQNNGAIVKADLGDKPEQAGEKGRELAISRSAAEVRAELEGAIILAKRFPRDDLAIVKRIEDGFSRKKLAAMAQYAYPRGGKQIRGPSVHSARAIAQSYGNIRWGLDIIRDDEDFRTIKGWAWELERNIKIEAQDHFQKLIYRKVGGWMKPDERDLRELTNRRGAILIRNCLLQAVPPDLVDRAIEIANKTLLGELKNRKDAIRQMVSVFDKIGVSVAMLVDYLGHDLETIDQEEFVDLRSVHTSIVDGNSKREDYFTLTPGKKPEGENGKISPEDVKGKKEKGENLPPPSDKGIDGLLVSFMGHDVEQPQIEAYIGKPVGKMSGDDYRKLLWVLTSIEEGKIEVQEVFPTTSKKPKPRGRPAKKKPGQQGLEV